MAGVRGAGADRRARRERCGDDVSRLLFAADAAGETGGAGSVPGAAPRARCVQESDLDLEGLSEPQFSFAHIQNALLQAGGPQGRIALVRREIARIGMQWLSYVALDDQRGHVLPVSVLMTYANEPFMRAYMDRELWRADLRLGKAAEAVAPQRWSLSAMREAIGERDVDPRMRELLEHLHAHSVRSGLFMLMPGFATRHMAVVSVTSPREGCDWMDDACIGQALVLASGIHAVEGAAMYRLNHPVPATDPEVLSSVQQQVLQCLCQGQCDKSIATTLGMSTYNVDYHLRTLRRRFGVRNRVQLVQAVRQQGLVAAG